MAEGGSFGGVLKQQCVDENGLYVWLRKTFSIDMNQKLLLIQQNEHEEVAKIPLSGAKYAKEWSFSSSLAGYGFDLVWCSGKIWSFLVDDEAACKLWVEKLNQVVAVEETEDDSSINSGTKPPLYPLSTHPSDATAAAAATLSATINQVNIATASIDSGRSISDSNETQLDAASPMDVMKQRTFSEAIGTEPKTEKKYPHSRENQLRGIEAALLQSTREAQQRGVLPEVNADGDPESTQLHHSSTMHPRDATESISSPLSVPPPPPPLHSSNDPPQGFASTAVPSYGTLPVDRVTQKIFSESKAGANVPSSTSIEPSLHRNTSEEIRKAIERASVQIEQHDTGRADLVGDIYEDAELAREAVSTMKKKCNKAETMLERRQQEINELKQKLHSLEDQLDHTTLDYEKKLEQARERERSFIKESKREIDGRILRVSNDNASYYEANIQQLKTRHERELSCLQEQLEEERDRHHHQVESLQSTITTNETKLKTTEHSLEQLQNQLLNIKNEQLRLKKEHEIERNQWERKKKRLIEESEATIHQLHDEKDQLLLLKHQEMKQKVIEMNEKMSTSLLKLHETDQKSLKSELEGDFYRKVTEIQKKCQQDIEAVRTEERRIAANEIESIRLSFQSIEKQTSDDLINLEKLHSLRILQLEKKINELKNQNKILEEKLLNSSKIIIKENLSTENYSKQLQQNIEENLKNSEKLKNDLINTNQQLQESLIRETLLKNQLNEILTENRLQRAELIELKEQVTNGSASASQWRQATKESEISITAAESMVNIAKDEILMLETALKRKEEENFALRRDLLRSDRLIYGVPQHELPDDNNRTYEVSLQPNCLFMKNNNNTTPIITDVPLINVDYTMESTSITSNNHYKRNQRLQKNIKRRTLDSHMNPSNRLVKQSSASYTPMRNTTTTTTAAAATPVRGGGGVKMIPKHTISSAQKLRTKQ